MIIHGPSNPPTAFEIYQDSLNVGLRGGSATAVTGSGALTLNIWNFICGVIDGTTGTIYSQGAFVNSGPVTAPQSTPDSVNIGAYLDGDYAFNGTIDDVMIFNQSLSAEQVLALYQNRTDLIVSQETSKGENWSACITPNDGFDDGVERCSNNITIMANNAPTATNVVLNSSDDHPFNRTNGTLTGHWTFSDSDSDPQVDNETRWYNNSVEVTALVNVTVVGSGNTTKDQNWTFSVRVNDGFEWGNWVNATMTIENAAPNWYAPLPSYPPVGR